MKETIRSKIAHRTGLAVALLGAAGLYFGFGGDCSDEKLSEKMVRTQLKENASLEIIGMLGNAYFANFPAGSERILYAFDFDSNGKYDRIKEKITSNDPHNQSIYERTLDNPKDKEFQELTKILRGEK